MLTITIPVMLILIYIFDLPYLPVMFGTALVMCVAAWGVSHDRFIAQAGAALVVIGGVYFPFVSMGIFSQPYLSVINVLVVIVIAVTMLLATIEAFKKTLKF